MLRFAICEAIALIALVASITAGVRERHAHLRIDDPPAALLISPLITALTITAAVAAGLIPVLFYGPQRLR